MGDAGKVCFSKASSTAGRVAHKATNGRVIYKRTTDTKHATIKIDFVGITDEFTTGAWAQWGRSSNSIKVGAGDSNPFYPDYESEGLHSSWVDGVVEYIEGSAPSEKSLQFRAWLSEYLPVEDLQYENLLYIQPAVWFRLGSFFGEIDIDVTVTQDGVPTLSARYTLLGPDPFAVGFNSSGEAFRIFLPHELSA